MVKKLRIKNKKTFAVAIAVLTLLVLIIAVVISLAVLGRPIDKSSKDTVIVNIKEGSGTAQIAAVLHENRLIRSEMVFKIRSKISFYDGKYKAGDYALSKAMSMKEIAQTIISGRSAGQSFQTIEGETIKQTAKRLQKQGIVSEKEFLKEATEGDFDYRFMDQLPAGENRLEGFLFPNMYEVSVNADAHEVIDTMLAEFDSTVTDDYYKKAKKMGYSMYEMITLASIVEREAVENEDRPKIASVLYNRLEKNIKLQCCSTVQYILGEQKPVLSNADTRIESPYNTYIIDGLPKGPICSPGKASIDAVFEPADTDYLYFVLKSKDSTSHNFSKNYEEFIKDKNKYAESFK